MDLCPVHPIIKICKKETSYLFAPVDIHIDFVFAWVRLWGVRQHSVGKRELANLTVSDVIVGVFVKNLHTNQRDGGGPEQFVWNYFDLHI